MTISFGFNIVTCDTGVIRLDNCHIILYALYFMHSFITIPTVFISTVTPFINLIFRELGTVGSGAGLGPGLSLQTINTIEERETEAHTVTPNQRHKTPDPLNEKKKI